MNFWTQLFECVLFLARYNVHNGNILNLSKNISSFGDWWYDLNLGVLSAV